MRFSMPATEGRMLNRLIHRGKGAVALFALLLAACGGGGGGAGDGSTGLGSASTPPASTAPSTAVAQQVSAAAAVAANDTATNSSSSFAVLQSAGVPVVQVQSPPKVNFTVFSNGKVVQGLALTNVSFAIAKLVPGANGNPDQWVNYVYRKETATPTVGPNGKAALVSAMQATTDPKQTDATLAAQQLVYNADGYYTYTFKTNITDPTQTNGVAFEPARTHRIAIQLSYQNAAGQTVLVNPYYDFTFDANGNAVALTDPATQTRKMTDVAQCNTCHEKLGMHGGGRVDTQFCVMCHNPGTTDANSGNVLTLATMAHKIHAGKKLKAALDAGKGGEDYVIWGYKDTKVDFAEVGFPQDLRNCTKCHTSSNPNTPQGDNWKTRPSREACLTCHENKPGSFWFSQHTFYNENRDPNAAATLLPNSECARCHAPGGAIAPERVHWAQNIVDTAKYKMNIESAAYDTSTRKVTVKYFLSDPTNGNTAYNLVTSDCTAAAPNVCANTAKFGNLRFYVAYQSVPGQNTATTEFSSFNNGGGTANAYAYLGTNDGNNHYTATISLPDDSATHVVSGSARVLSIGQVKEPQLQLMAATDPRPEVTPRTLINVGVQHAYVDIALAGNLVARRQIVSTDKCNACHGQLGTASGSNTLADAFHGGGRNYVEACVLCHDPNRMSTTVMTNGLSLNESYQFKRLIHGIHGSSQRTYPFTQGNTVVGIFNKDGTSVSGGAPLAANVENYAAEVAYPAAVNGVPSLNCNACHVNNSYENDRGTLGAVVQKPAGVTDPLQWSVISPRAATCTSCHDSSKAIGHVTSFGLATFGDRTQAQSLQREEICADCHSSGGFKGIDIVHGLQ
jgi:OmcA/MtrC family decaheme c-type cytochrome